MKVSIALAVYNGATYLDQQLASFLGQTRLPDELVVCDDGSTDDTALIVESFAKRAPFVVRYSRNTTNLGYTRNFERCLSLCSGEVIFFSDQDDVWFPEKIDCVMSHFASGQELKVTINDQEITDAELLRSGRTIFGNSERLGFGERWFSAGCCTAMTRAFLELALPFPQGPISHDGWVHTLARALGVRQVIPDVLQLYRRHALNTSSSLAVRKAVFPVLEIMREHGMKVSLESWAGQLRISEVLLERLGLGLEQQLQRVDMGGVSASIFEQALARETRRSTLVRQRLQMLTHPRLLRLPRLLRFHHLGGYEVFQGWKSFLKDVLRPAVSADQLNTAVDWLKKDGPGR